MDILQDRQYRDYGYLCRYTNIPYYFHTEDKKFIYGTGSQLDDTTKYMLYKTLAGESFDSIALKFYNNPTYFWVICDFNRIQDPYTKLEIGTELKIPFLNDIMFEENN